MEKYKYSEAEYKLLAESQVPLAVYQFINNRVVTIVISDGLCELFGFADRAKVYELMETNMYRDTHPDDVLEISEEAYRFAVEGGNYDVLYRSKMNGVYRVIHACGKHIYKENGVRLALVWYTDLGVYNESFAKHEDNRTLMRGKQFDVRKRHNRINFDYLTGLPSMTYFFDLAEDGCNELKANGFTPAILFMDFNGMKSYNRENGMAEGDKVLIAFTEILISFFGNSSCSRFGSDHFVVYTKAEGVEDIAKAIIDSCQKLNGGRSLPVRIGIYYHTDMSMGISTACDRAKIACDSNKKTYESHYCIFDDSMMERIERRHYVVENIDRAVSEGWIKVYYQPIVRTANGRVCNEEALARWEDPERGFFGSEDIIPFLEEANSIYKLDLYIVDQVLLKMKNQAENGLFVVPESVNLSRSDFYTCDIVEEIRKRIDSSGLTRDKLVIEITESIVGDDLEYMAEQITRFKDLGFTVWMDDYGSGYSSPMILQKIPFDLIKIDMLFVMQIDKSETAKIILTEMVRMAVGLGIETIAEGVETKEQADFLKEIGCTKLQGYYYCRPVSLEQILERYRNGTAIGFENPDETEYYVQLGKVNLYDLSISRTDDDSLKDYFDTWPMVMIECRDEIINITRCNVTFREFMARTFPDSLNKTEFRISDYMGKQGDYSLKAVLKCAKDGRRMLIDDRTRDGKTIQLFIRRVAVNPVNGVSAVSVAVLSVTDSPNFSASLTYNYAARTLSEDYLNIYFVNMDTGDFTEYIPDGANLDISLERHGKNFFEASAEDAQEVIYSEDRDYFLSVFNKKNVEKNLKEHGIFTTTYRIMDNGAPVYINMKIVKVRNRSNYIIIGVNNVDAQMRREEALEKMREEQLTYSRIIALSGDYMSIYTINPITDAYVQYSSTEYYDTVGTSKEGDNFFEEALITAHSVIYEEDVEYFEKSFSKEIVLQEIERTGLYTLNYRLMVQGIPRYVFMKATMVHEDGEDMILMGIINIDSEVRKEQEYASNLLEAREQANFDELTGVKNKHAYVDAENHLNQIIKNGDMPEFAIVIFDINGLKQVNDTQGHRAGDKFIKEGCKSICRIFKHSPVFRLGGDEFAVIVQGRDYKSIDTLMESVARSNKLNEKDNKVVIAAGMSKYNHDKKVSEVFERADKNMYENKKHLKSEGPKTS